MKKVVLIVIFFLLVTISLRAKDSLKGLEGFQVMVMMVGYIKEDMLKSQIQTDLELKLRLAGIKVIDEENCNANNAVVIVIIHSIDCTLPLQFQYPIYAYSYSIEVWQEVSLVRDPDIVIDTSTYFLSNVGLLLEDMKLVLRDRIKDSFDTFLNDYLSVNPK